MSLKRNRSNRQSDFTSNVRERGDGDKIFDALGELYSEVKSGGFEAAFKKLKSPEWEEKNLPPPLLKVLTFGGRAFQARAEDIRESWADARDFMLVHGQPLFDKCAAAYGMPSREEIDAMRARIDELERRSLQVTKEVVDKPMAATHDSAPKISRKRSESVGRRSLRTRAQDEKSL